VAKKITLRAKAADGSVVTYSLVAKSEDDAKALLEARAASRGATIGAWL
jgi:hypothetical protein